MARGYQIFGEFIVNVRGGGHLPGAPDFNNLKVAQLGLTSESVTIIPSFRYGEINVDDYGPDIPAELMQQMGDVRVKMTLVHYDELILQTCMQESLAGGDGFYSIAGDDGIFSQGGKLMGNNLPMYASGNYYMSVSLVPSTAGIKGWRFISCYLDCSPLTIPVGTQRSLAQLSWRGIPYSPMNSSGEVLSSGIVLWDRVVDLKPT